MTISGDLRRILETDWDRQLGRRCFRALKHIQRSQSPHSQNYELTVLSIRWARARTNERTLSPTYIPQMITMSN